MIFSREATIAGATIFIKLSANSDNFVSGEKRAKKQNPTSEKVAEMNLRYSERALSMILNHNFCEGDYHLTLTYRGEEFGKEAVRKILKAWKRKLSDLYRKEGVILKWVCVTEYQNKRVHHHMIISGGVDIAKIRALWKYGYANATLLDATGDYRKLAAYLIKETAKAFRGPDAISKRRFDCSRSVKRPEHKEPDEISASSLFEEPKSTFKGYHIDKDSIYKGTNIFTGLPCVEYVLIADDAKNPKRTSLHRRKNKSKAKVQREQAKFNTWLRENGHEQIVFDFE